MILRNLRVQGFGCFADEVELGPFCDGINLLYAPNGTGKSTLVKALTMALVDSYRVKCAELQDWKPWGRSLTPRIVVEFDHRAASYRMEKRFLQGAASVLLREEGAGWKQFMQNEDADDFVRKDILNCSPPGSGMAKAKHWGLAQILWTTQGDLALPELTGNVVEAIQQSVGATLTAAGSKIESKLTDLYAEFFTPARGTLKRTAPLNGLQKEYDQLVAEEAVAEQELTEFDRNATRIDEFRTKLSDARGVRSGLVEQRKTASERVEQYRALQSERLQTSERKNARQAIYLNVRQNMDRILETRGAIEQAGAVHAKAVSELPAREAEKEAREKSLREARKSIESASTARQHANATLVVAQLAREYVQTLAEIESVSAAIAEAAQISDRIAELAAKKAGLSAPTAQQLAQASKLVTEAQQHAIRLEVARITVELTPAADASIRITEGERTGLVDLRAGDVARISGTPNAAFEIPGFGAIRVRGPITDYAVIRSQLDKCETDLRVIEERYGTRDIGQLDTMRADYTAIEQEIERLDARRAGVLAQTSTGKLDARRAQLSARSSEIEAAHPEWRNSRPVPEELENTARRASEQAESALREAEHRGQQADHELLASVKALSTARAELLAAGQKLQELESTLRNLTADGRTDGDRRRELDEALIEYEAARVRMDRLDEQWTAMGGDPAPFLASTERDLATAEQKVRELETGILQAEADMRLLAAKSPYDRLTKLKEAAALAASALERESRRMDAIKLLNEVVTETKAGLLSSVAEPVEKAANENLAAICPQVFGNIRMSPAFGPAGIRPAGLTEADGIVPISQLSGGEKEQLHLCARLALAAELAKEERQLLVLDDVLTFTDNERVTRICELLARAAGRLQVLILTCHPDRFIEIEHARTFDLESLVRSKTVAM